MISDQYTTGKYIEVTTALNTFENYFARSLSPCIHITAYTLGEEINNANTFYGMVTKSRASKSHGIQ